MNYQSRIIRIMILLLSVLSATALAQPAAEAPPAPTAGDQALAERFAALAQESMRQGRSGTAVYEQAAALLQAATRLNPTEPRHWRLLSEALAGVGDNKPTQDALTSLLRLNPSNPSVYVQLMHLYLQDMETLDAQLAYLVGDVQKPGLVKREELPAQVRSAAAAVAAQLSLEQGAVEQARLLVAHALELNPVNPDAAELNWLLLQDSDDEVARTRAALALVQAQPRSPHHLVALARQLARAGFLDQSLTWFGQAATLGQQTASLNPQELIADWASAMFVTNNPFDADRLVDQLLASNPDDVEGWFMRLLLDRNSGDRQVLSQSLGKAREVMLRRLHAVRSEVGLVPENAAAGAELPPNLEADIPTLQADDTPAAAKAAYATAIHDLLWLELYFQGPSDATSQLLEVLRAVAPADNTVLARLEGWNFLLQNKRDEAQVKLSAVADRDPLAALGLLRMVDRNDDQAMRRMTDDGRRLLGDNPYGLVGAFLAAELRPYGVRAELPEASRAIARQVDDFTRDWPRIYSDPNSFYQVRARVIGVAHPVGKPMIAEIQIKNISGFDLSIDPRGVIQPNLWFNARLSGVINQDISGIAIDQLMQGLVLPARQTMVQHVRLDQVQLSNLLYQHPQISVQIMFNVVTNPATVHNEQGEAFVVPGPLGQRRDFQNLIERVAMPVQRLERHVNDIFRDDDAAATLNTIDLVRAYLPLLGSMIETIESDAADPDQTKALRQLEPSLHLSLNRKMQDKDRAVRAWASYTLALRSSGDEQAEILRQMRASDDWAAQLLSLVAAQTRPPEQVKDIASRLLDEERDPLVRRMAQATIAVADLPTTNPATPGD